MMDFTPAQSRRGGQPVIPIRTLGLVSLDHLSAAGVSGPRLERDTYERVLGILDRHRCDTVLFALPWRGASPDCAPGEPLWAVLAFVQSVYLGTTEGSLRLHERGREVVELRPLDGVVSPQDGQLLRSLPERVRAGTLALFGSDLAALTLKRTPTRHFVSPPGWEEALAAQRVRTILNPLETYVRRWEMKPKREFLSRSGRTFVAIWNRTTVNESARTWTVHTDGAERTGDVMPVADPALPAHVTAGLLVV